MTNQTKTYEPAKETAKKIRRYLKENFSGVKFKVTTSRSGSVYVDFTDSNFTRETIQDAVSIFKSSYFDGMTDMKTTNGYTCPFDGQKYSGADYILVSRDVTNERREVIKAHGISLGYEPSEPGDYEYTRFFNDSEEHYIKYVINGIDPEEEAQEEITSTVLNLVEFLDVELDSLIEFKVVLSIVF